MSCEHGDPTCESDRLWSWQNNDDDWRYQGTPTRIRALILCEQHTEERKVGMQLSKKIGRAVSRLEARMQIAVAIIGMLFGCAGDVETESEMQASAPVPCEAGVHNCALDVPVAWQCPADRAVPIGCTARGPAFCCPEGIEP